MVLLAVVIGALAAPAHMVYSGPPLAARGKRVTRGTIDMVAATPVGATAKDWSGPVGVLFNNLRTPAALVAGAAFGGAFGMPLSPSDGIALGFAKRLYVIVAVMSLGAELLVMIASTVALQGMSVRAHEMAPADTATKWIEANCELEWVACQVHFVAGVLGLTLMVALRAWVSIACPKLALAALGVISSILLLMLSIVNVGYSAEGRTPFCAAIRYGTLLLRRARQHEGGPLLILGLLIGAVSTVRMGVVLWGTWGYLQAMAA